MEKKTLWLICIIVILLPIALIGYFYYYDQTKIAVSFVNQKGLVQKIEVALAMTPQEIKHGLMGVKHLDENGGMLFVFDDAAPRGFWMKDVLIPLDIIFIDQYGKVVNIVYSAEPCLETICPTYPSEDHAKFVLEVNGGFAKRHGLAINDTVSFDIE
ncbi:MAG: hypothetical protein COT81_02110 [Candidatus Buchananbacteria bacterium CG10_big_fil_rev_8_21_14_0_10_42_9]|uniref:DUF192 domain-containing protein n=1 Tax=Candidatus Buchananbacteria bacterium CG10_big_fil_rev_8_21_14_0_10_42_9 TaxID=1974526 RepID=A0A2H0W1L1_9BACT|nr:MAG: hypothetical protein COT81_02110 [Candidatus Buchananbacteria bacterium CG10_big_fil_rev_8_21_14_0_10_42_9]